MNAIGNLTLWADRNQASTSFSTSSESILDDISWSPSPGKSSSSRKLDRGGTYQSLFDIRQSPPLHVAICIVLWSLCIYLIITHFLGGAIEVQGRSMSPTLANGDTYLLNRWTYRFRAPARGELVVLRDPGHTDMAIKRIVAVGGEHVEFKDAGVYIDGKLMVEPYLAENTQTFPANIKRAVFDIPENHFFVLGDNREDSFDSRFYGPLHRDNIVGLVTP